MRAMKSCIPILLSMLILAPGSFSADRPEKASSVKPIRHTVFFVLKHAPGSQEEKEFFQAARKLAEIPTVKKFQALQEVSPKNKFTYGFSMEFADQADYNSYNQHPEHVKFVQEIWIKQVEDFMEIDYVAMPGKPD